MSDSPNFAELPVDVQVALINAAALMSTEIMRGIHARGREPSTDYLFFEKEYKKICDALYKENRGRR